MTEGVTSDLYMYCLTICLLLTFMCDLDLWSVVSNRWTKFHFLKYLSLRQECLCEVIMEPILCSHEHINDALL